MSNDIKTILKTAISEKMKASRFYSNLALQMEDKGARLKFEIMAAIELKHYEFLLSWYQEKFKQPLVLQETGKCKIVRPETPQKTASFDDAIKGYHGYRTKGIRILQKGLRNLTGCERPGNFDMLAEWNSLILNISGQNTTT